MIAASIKSLRNMPLVELLDKPANRNTATFEVTLLYNPEQKSVVNTFTRYVLGVQLYYELFI